jgi:hypothetical protein
VIGKRRIVVGGTLIVGTLAASGCASPPHSAPAAAKRYGPPEQATLSWFYAINHKDGAAAAAHIARAAGPMDWGHTSTWSTFSALRCKPASMQSTTAATVYGSFSESSSESEGNPDNWWSVSLQRRRDGRWLINSYGQG